MPDTVPGGVSTTATITIGGTVTGTIDTLGDHDWYRITLDAGEAIDISLAGTGTTPGLDTYLRIRDSAGNVVAFNDDGGAALDSFLTFIAATGGTYYIDVGTFSDASTGQFELNVDPGLPFFTYNQIADQLVNGYWGGPSQAHHFNVAPGGTLTVNLTALNADGQTLARAALAMWSDVIGVTFSEVTTGGQITFDDEDTGAFCSASWSGGITSSAFVNVGRDWLATYTPALNGYAFQTYIHEIGHALGLGHGGNYNGSASYLVDADYVNDCWSTTVMSYFSQTDNSYFGGQGFNYGFVLSPMNADIVAMSMLYGLSTTTRTGNTTYGFASNANRSIFNAALFPAAAYTIIDNGGVDTLNYSGYSAGQVINLNQETFSNIGGNVGNVVIARGTVIENANGGSGADTIHGNTSNNVLNGNGGNDTLNGNGGNDTLDGGAGNDRLNGGAGSDTASYAGATAGVTVSLGITAAQNTVGAGTDTLTQMENLSGSNLNDTLTGNTAANRLAGGGGNDILNGEAGNDTLNGGPGNDTLNGGAGTDAADYANATAGVTVRLIAGAQNTVGAGTDTLVSIENILGSAFNDRLTGNSGANTLTGNAGNDTLVGAGGNDVLNGGDGTDALDGGLGDDTLIGGTGVDTARYSSATAAVNVNLALTAAQNTLGAGTDRLSQVENLLGSNFGDTLTGNAAANRIDGGIGNDRIDGGGGRDVLLGGAGADKFVFSTAPNSSTNWDGISDFVVADDTILLSSGIFSAAGPVGTLAAARFRAGTAALDADDRIIYDQATGSIWYDADGNGAGAKVLFAKVAAGTALTRLDFQIFAPSAEPLQTQAATLADWSIEPAGDMAAMLAGFHQADPSYLYA